VSFDVFLERNVDEESTEVYRSRVRNVLQSTRFEGPDPFGFYIVYFLDGAHVEFSAGELENSSSSFTSCAFHARGIAT